MTVNPAMPTCRSVTRLSQSTYVWDVVRLAAVMLAFAVAQAMSAGGEAPAAPGEASDVEALKQAHEAARRAVWQARDRLIAAGTTLPVTAKPLLEARERMRELQGEQDALDAQLRELRERAKTQDAEASEDAAKNALQVLQAKRDSVRKALNDHKWKVYFVKCQAYLAETPEGADLVRAYFAAQKAERAAYADLVHAQGRVLPEEWVRSLPRPRFKPDHSLLKLSRFGWSIPIELKIELARHWGYALPFSGYLGMQDVELTQAPGSEQARLVELAQAEPDVFKIAVICNRAFPQDTPEGTWTHDAEGRPINGKGKSIDGTDWGGNETLVISPEAPDALAEAMAQGRARPIAALRKRVPISIVLNGGEYGLGVYGFAGKAWERDPRILEAKGEQSWIDYLSTRKSRQEKIISDRVKAAADGCDAYVFYQVHAGGDWGRYGHFWKWAGARFRDLHVISDFSSAAIYYQHWNSGFTGDQDMLTKRLNGIEEELRYGRPLAYHWFWAGFQKKQCDLNRYRGLIKMIYITGCIGGNAGNYDNSARPTSFDPNGSGYQYYPEMIALARVHALFSHLDTYIRDGDLLPGPYCHPWSRTRKAYEFLPEELAGSVEPIPNEPAPALPPGRAIRVIARKYRTNNQWLVGAWAADGNAQPATVTIPGAGRVSLLARPGGSTYLLHATGNGTEVHLCDPDEAYPSRSFTPPPWWP